jgi:hypothetical protein
VKRFVGLVLLRIARILWDWAVRAAGRVLTDAPPLDMSGGGASSTPGQEEKMGIWFLTSKSRLVSSRPPRPRKLAEAQSLTFVTRRFVWTFLHIKGWGTTYWGRSNGRDVRVWHPTCLDYSEVKRMKKKAPPSNAGGAKHLASIESNILSQCHALVKHCAITQYDDGEPRKPGWITVKTFGSAWQVEAKDPDSCLVLRVVENSLDEALALMTLLLESEEAPWEQDTWLMQQQAKSRKK